MAAVEDLEVSGGEDDLGGEEDRGGASRRG
jgi:hypothetical protein